MMLIAAPGAPVINHSRPLMMKSSPMVRGGLHRIGSGAAVRFRHREMVWISLLAKP
jgi:hypothetical protein